MESERLNRALVPTPTLRWYQPEEGEKILQQWWDSPFSGESGSWENITVVVKGERGWTFLKDPHPKQNTETGEGRFDAKKD